MKYSLVKTIFVVASSLLVASCGETTSSASSVSATVSSTDSVTSSDSSKFYAYEANSDLVFNEFDVGVSANDRALELANKGDNALDLSAYSIAIYHANDQKPSYFVSLA